MPGVGNVTFQKRRGTKSLRIRIQGSEVKVTMPHWTPYVQAVAFVKSKSKWIQANRAQPNELYDGAYIGKNHQLSVNYHDSSRVTTRITDETVSVHLPRTMSNSSATAQKKLQAATQKALLHECETLLSPFVQDLSLTHELPYNSLTYKKLKSRWGSCDSDNNIVLNLYLIQLSWDKIQYVVIHELAHTKHHNHGADFWREVEKCLPNFKTIRKSIKEDHPNIVVS